MKLRFHYFAPLLLAIFIFNPISYASNNKQITASVNMPSFDIAFGYGTFNLTLHVPTPVNQLEFDYGSPNYELNSWGPINLTNATVSSTDLHNGLYHYVITPKDSTHPFQPIDNQIAIQQIPLLTSSPPTKNMDFTSYYGLFQNIKINGDALAYVNACQGDACKDPLPNKMIGGYYADWSVYPSSGEFKPQDLNLTHMNTVFYAFGSVDSQTGEALMFDPYADASMMGVNAVPYLSLQRVRYPYLNLSYSFGGWGSPNLGNYQSGEMSLLFTYHPEHIQNFADTLVHYIHRAGFNAIDIDYEWNAPQVPNPPHGEKPLGTELTQQTADGYVTLLYDIRHEKDLPSHFKLTVALPAGKNQIDVLAGFKYQGPIPSLTGQSDLAILATEVDTIDLMTYDYHGAFDASQPHPYNVTNLLAPLTIAAEDPTNADPILKTFNIKGSVAAIKQADPHLQNSQLVIGIPAYGRLEQIAPDQIINPDNRGVFLTLATDQAPAAGEWGNSVVDYRCLTSPQTDCFNSYQLPTDMTYLLGPFDNSDPIGNTVQTAWAYSTAMHQFISFDSAATTTYKAKWITQQGFQGVMLWELDGDLNKNTDSNYDTQSILMNLYRGLKN